MDELSSSYFYKLFLVLIIEKYSVDRKKSEKETKKLEKEIGLILKFIVTQKKSNWKIKIIFVWIRQKKIVQIQRTVLVFKWFQVRIDWVFECWFLVLLLKFCFCFICSTVFDNEYKINKF